MGVASSRLLLPLPAGLSAHSPAWLQKAVDPDQPVIFLDTDQVVSEPLRLGPHDMILFAGPPKVIYGKTPQGVNGPPETVCVHIEEPPQS